MYSVSNEFSPSGNVALIIVIFESLDNNQKEFLEFVLSKYIEVGIEELGEEKLPDLLKIKYHAINDATEVLGGVDRIRKTFINFQKHLFEEALSN